MPIDYEIRHLRSKSPSNEPALPCCPEGNPEKTALFAIEKHCTLVQVFSTRLFPRDSRIEIESELHFVRHRVVQGFVEGCGTRLD